MRKFRNLANTLRKTVISKNESSLQEPHDLEEVTCMELFRSRQKALMQGYNLGIRN